MLRHLITCLLLTMVTLSPLSAAPAGSPRRPPAEILRLRARATELFAKRDRARRGGVPLLPLHDELVALADTLEAAGLDSVAADALRKAGGVVQRTARGRAAEDDWRRAIALARRAGDRDCELEARALLASSVGQRDPESALRMMEETVAFAQRHREYPALPRAWFTISNANATLGRMREAREAAFKSLYWSRSNGDKGAVATALQLVAQCLHFEKQDARALLYADSAIAIARADPDLGQDLARALVARANSLRDLKREAEAQASLLEALSVDRQRGDLRHALRTRSALALLFLSRDQVRPAFAHYDTLCDEARRADDPLMLNRATAGKGYALAELSRWAEAETLLARAVPRFEQSRDDQDDAENRAGLFLRGGEMYATWSRCLVELGRTREAWRVAERGRAAVFRQQLALDEQAAVGSLTALQARLRADQAVLLQYTEPQRNPQYVFVIDGDSVRAILLGRITVAADAKLARSLLADGAPVAQVRLPLGRIARALLAEPLRRVGAGTKRLWVLPPSEAAGLPFECLPVSGAGGATLGDRYAVSYPLSATAVEQLAGRTPGDRGLVVFADPDARSIARAPGSPAGLRQLARAPLRGAREEARGIAPFGTTVWTGRDATRERLAASGDRAVVHLATHAWVDPSHPDQSGLLLAGADGLVTAAQVESLTIRADLVTMSGCRTAQGEALMGEGVFGLPRAFLLAGARSVVSTAWEVEDRAASRFMQLFYADLRRGLPRDEALKRARITMRAERWPPRDTEAFVLTGLGSPPVAALAPRAGLFGR